MAPTANAWHAHLMQTYRSSNVPLAEAMQLASATYRNSMKIGDSSAAINRRVQKIVQKIADENARLADVKINQSSAEGVDVFAESGRDSILGGSSRMLNKTLTQVNKVKTRLKDQSEKSTRPKQGKGSIPKIIDKKVRKRRRAS